MTLKATVPFETGLYLGMEVVEQGASRENDLLVSVGISHRGDTLNMPERG